jgi:cyclic pyranopterin phosphate synthase
MDEQLTHLDSEGAVRMVDVSAKEVTVREAVAEAAVTMHPETRDRLFGGELPKGDALASVRIAGIMGAKRTAELIPLCHPVPIEGITVDVEPTESGAVIRSTVRTSWRTGVEMEAMTAVTTAALALYDMVKGIERGVTIGPISLRRKTGGRSGTWEV